MPKWIEKPYLREWVEHSLCWYWKEHPSSGYRLDCDKDGKVPPDRQKRVDEINAMEGLDGPYLESVERSYFESGVIRCACGAKHNLQRYDSSCSCGRYYNACGQELNPPHMWEEPIEEDNW